jgi:hypothetical protein
MTTSKTASSSSSSSMLLLAVVTLLATTCSARTLLQDPPDDTTTSFDGMAAAAAAPSSFCPCMESDSAAVAAATAACNLDNDPNADCTNKEEFPLEAAEWVAAYYTHNKLWPPQRYPRSASLFKVGADGKREAVTVAAGGVAPQGVFSFNYKLGPFRISGTIDTSALSVNAKAEVKLLFWWKTIGSININPLRPCITLGYPKIVSLSLCLDLPGRALTLNASIVGKNVSVKLIRW